MGNSNRGVALVASLAVVVHAAALRGGFVWLDHAHIEDGVALAPLSRWHSLFTEGFAGTGFYRPLMSLSLAVDAMFATGPTLFHFTTLLAHVVAAALLVVAAQSLGLSRRAATIAGVIFAVHPLTSLVASAIAFRSESMMTAALLALIVLHERRHPIAGLALLAAALTKETGLVLGPLFVCVLSYESHAKARRNEARASAPFFLWTSEAVGFAIAIALRFAYAPAWRASPISLPPADAWGTRLASIGKAAWRTFIPIDGTICDAFSVASPLSLFSIAGAMTLAFIAYLAYSRRAPASLLLLSILPALQIIPVMRWWSPHYFYLPLAFVAMLAAEFLERRRERSAQHVVTCCAAALAVWTAWLDLRYESDTTLWEPEIVADARCREGQFYLAEVARKKGDFADAAHRYEQALALTPGVLSYVDRVPAWQNLGVTRLELGQFDEARNAFRSALGLVVDDGYRRVLTHNLATTELRAGNAAEAARLLEKEASRTDALLPSLYIRARAIEVLERSADHADDARTHLQTFPSAPVPPLTSRDR